MFECSRLFPDFARVSAAAAVLVSWAAWQQRLTEPSAGFSRPVAAPGPAVAQPVRSVRPGDVKRGGIPITSPVSYRIGVGCRVA